MFSQTHKFLFLGLLALTLLLGTSTPATAQLGMGGGGNSKYALEDDERNLKFAGVPIPNYSQVLGASLGVVGMAYYKLDRHDDDLPPSATGLFGFFSENNSWIGAGFQKIHYDEDKWRGTLAFGTGSVKYQFNPASLNPVLPDIFLDYTTGTGFVYMDGSHRTWNKLYLGLAVMSWSAQVSLEPDIADIPEERYTGPGMTAEWDARDHVMSPTEGYALTARLLCYDSAFGSERTFKKLNLSASGYASLGDSTQVLAGRIYNEAALGDVPFSGQAIVSGNRNLRGYANGRHRGNNLLSLEAEYRWNFWGRWGTAVFAGVAFVAEDMASMSMADALPATGFGLRFRMIEAYRINARADIGWGKHDHGIYFSIGEAF